jgi:hypothetical protein
MSDFPWFNAEEELQRPKRIGMPESIFQLKPTYPHWEDTEDIPFTNTLKNRFVRKVPASLKSFMIAFLCRPDLIVGNIATQLENLNIIYNCILGWQKASGDT